MASPEVKYYSNAKYLHSNMKYKLQAGGVWLWLYQMHCQKIIILLTWHTVKNYIKFIHKMCLQDLNYNWYLERQRFKFYSDLEVLS